MPRRAVSQPSSTTAKPAYLPTKDVLSFLNIKPQTLYAYVARGWIRSFGQPHTRRKMYSRDDVERVRARSMARAGHGPAAAGLMRWGEPVISSSITQITADGPRYRGRLAVDLSRAGHPFETTADLLWTGVSNETGAPWSTARPPQAFAHASNYLRRALSPLQFQQNVGLIVQLLSAAQGGNPEATLGGTEPAARQLIHVVASAFAQLAGGQPTATRPGESITEILSRSMRKKLDDDDHELLNAALTLSADHELAPATFATRIAASTGAHLHECITVGLASWEGLGVDQIEDRVRNAKSKQELLDSIQLQQRPGRTLYGFNHPLYATIDPRARYLIDAVRAKRRITPKAKMFLDVIDAVQADVGANPMLSIGLVAVQLSLDLPTRSAGGLFLLGRLAGWVAHVQEQRLAGFLMRPRAKYAGP